MEKVPAFKLFFPACGEHYNEGPSTEARQFQADYEAWVLTVMIINLWSKNQEDKKPFLHLILSPDQDWRPC